MIKIVISGQELYDEEKNEFLYIPQTILKLEHSLISISKWESKWHKSFIYTKEKTNEEYLDYVKCMTINGPFDDDVYLGLTNKDWKEIVDYINDPMTATTVKEEQGRANEIVTAELIYYWMIAYGVPFECEKWHLNRLLTLLKVCSAKNKPQKNMSRREIYEQNRALNNARRRAHHTKG